MGLHVIFSERGGADGKPPIVQGDDGHGDSIGIHSCPDMVEPTVVGATGIEMSHSPKCDCAMTGARCGQSARAMIFSSALCLSNTQANVRRRAPSGSSCC